MPDELPEVTIHMHTPAPVTVGGFYDNAKKCLQLKLLAGEEGLNNVIAACSINRPALALAGYYKHFSWSQLQIFGAGEMSFLLDLETEAQERVLCKIFSKGVPAIAISRGLEPTEMMLRLANQYKTPILSSPLETNEFIPKVTIRLDQLFASRCSIHGTLVDVRGIGVLVVGESGVGKSECALALIERGHSLVADDYVEVKLLGDRGLLGSAKEDGQGKMECRGVGLVDIGAIFGVHSVILEKSIDLVVHLVFWREGAEEDRTGLDTKTFEILGQRVPYIIFPVRPGRDVAQVVEVAALIQALRMTGRDCAKEFNERLIQKMRKNAVTQPAPSENQASET
ncbi:MAG: HPr(Ser) kinase/phosphatase [Puniceicoccales bacterium]|nr:HPr(Ser) kinase/phosphatase [Puniceicoccales bacterium]